MSKGLKTKVVSKSNATINALVRVIPKIYREMGRHFGRLEEPSDQLSPPHFRALVTLAELKKPLTLTELAHELGVSLGTASTTAKKLLRARYITKRRSEEDDRVVFVEIAKPGLEHCRKAEEKLKKVFTAVVANLSASQKRAFLEANQTVASILEAISEGEKK